MFKFQTKINFISHVSNEALITGEVWGGGGGGGVIPSDNNS